METMYVSLWKRAALCLACLGMIVPQGALVAAETKAQQPTVRMLDLKLTEGGKLTGQVVNAQGQVVRNAVVAVRYQNHVVAKATTDASGRYAVQGLRSGVHELETINGRVPARFWTSTAAPTVAKSSALIVSDTNVIRAQCAEQGCTTHPPMVAPAGNGCGGGWVAGAPIGGRARGCGLMHNGGLFRGGLFQQQDPCDPCAQNDGHGNLLVCGLVVAGIATAIAIAADDDDDNNTTSP